MVQLASIQQTSETLTSRMTLDSMVMVNGTEPSVTVYYSKVIGEEVIRQPSMMIPMSKFPSSMDLLKPTDGTVAVPDGITPELVVAIIFSMFKDLMDNPSQYVDDPEVAPSNSTGG